MVTTHALSQGQRRFPDLASLPEAKARERLKGEVTAALDAGRMARHRPRFLLRPGTTSRGNAHKLPPDLRYLWTAESERLLVVRRRRALDVLVTVIRPATEVAEGGAL